MKNRSDYTISTNKQGYTVQCGHKMFLPGVFTSEIQAEKAIAHDMGLFVAIQTKRGRPASSGVDTEE